MNGRKRGRSVADAGKEPFAIRVECYAGHRAEETPRRFFLGARKIEVADILDRWLSPDHRYFKVRGNEGGRYILRHDTSTGKWDLTLFEYDGER